MIEANSKGDRIVSRLCYNHQEPMPFEPCRRVMHVDENGKTNSSRSHKVGKFTISSCGAKEFHPKHMHCSDSLCGNIINTKHAAYTSEWKRKSIRKEKAH